MSLKRTIKWDRLSLDMLLSGICKPAAMLLSYIYVPIVLEYLGVEKYGVWSVILTIISWIGYFDIGIGNGLRNRLTEAIHKNSNVNAKKMVSSSYAISTIAMASLSLVFVFVAQFVDWNIILGVNGFNENLKLIVIESVILVAFNFVFNLCINVFYALQAASLVSFMQLLAMGINLIGVLLIRNVFQANLTVLAFLYGFSFVIVNLVGGFILYSKHKEFAPSIKEIDFAVGKDIIGLGFKFFVIQICAMILFATDSVIISVLYGATDVTPYSTVNKLYLAVSSIYIAFLSPIWSSVTKDKTLKNISNIKKTTWKMLFLLIPFVIISVLLFFTFRSVSFWWLKKELEYSDLLLFFGLLYCILNMWCSAFASVLNGMEVMKASVIIAMIQAVVNIPLSLLFSVTFSMESSGVLLGTVISMAIAAIAQPVVTYIYLKKMSRIKT